MEGIVWIEVRGYARIACALDSTLLEAFESASIPIDAACGGFAACSSCRVDVLAGSENLSACSPEEEPFLDAKSHRLACQARAHGDVCVKLAPGA